MYKLKGKNFANDEISVNQSLRLFLERNENITEKNSEKMLVTKIFDLFQTASLSELLEVGIVL